MESKTEGFIILLVAMFLVSVCVSEGFSALILSGFQI